MATLECLLVEAIGCEGCSVNFVSTAFGPGTRSESP